MERSTSKRDAAVLDAIARQGRRYVVLPEDRTWLESVVDDPAPQLARMKARGTLESLGWGRYLVLPNGASSARQVVGVPALVAALMHGRTMPYYVGFLSALAIHQLTDESVPEIHIAIRSRNIPTQSKVAGHTLRWIRLLGKDSWLGVERRRAEGRAFYHLSSVERTLLDCLDRPKECGSTETWVRAWERAMRTESADIGQLLDQALERRKATAARAAYWLRELGHVRESRFLLRAIHAPLTGRILLDRSRAFGDGPWHRDRETGLVLNLPESTVSGWLEYGK